MVVSSERLNPPDAVIIPFPRGGLARRAGARRRALVLRRLAVGLSVVAVLILELLGGGGGGTAEASHGTAPRAVVIRSGQTLWDLAERYTPAAMDPRLYVDDVLELNHLDAPPAAGVRIRLPR
jgi:LysM domain